MIKTYALSVLQCAHYRWRKRKHHSPWTLFLSYCEVYDVIYRNQITKKRLKKQIAIFSSSQNDNWFNICLFIFSTLQAMVEFYATFHTNICRTRFTRKKHILRKMISIDSYWVVKSKHFMRVTEISIVRNSQKKIEHISTALLNSIIGVPAVIFQ